MVAVFPVAPRPVATVAALGRLSSALPQVQPTLRAGSPWDAEASLSLGRTAGVRGLVGLAVGNRGLPRACLPSLGEGTGGFRQRGCSETGERLGGEGGAVGPAAWLPAWQLGQERPGSGPVNSPPLPRALAAPP